MEFIHERQAETVPGEWSEVVEVVNEGQPEAGDVVFTIECDNGQAADPGVTGEKQTEEITIEGGQEHERHHENVAVAVGIEDENHDNENNVSEWQNIHWARIVSKGVYIGSILRHCIFYLGGE